MKKKLFKVLGLSLLAFSMAACGAPKDKGGSDDNTPAQTITYTVAFEVDGQRVATSRVKAGEKVTDEIATPAKAGYTFVGWYEGETLVDLTTYVVTHNVTLVAHFEEISIPEYNINDTKEADKTYYLVLGWWECTDVQEDGVTPKLTSHLTPDTVRLFYHNLRAYLTTVGATEANLNAISFRNYSSLNVTAMGAAINADADVDILIGVGNNINSTAGVSLHGGSNDYKFATEMGDPLTSRTVACPASASDFGVATFEWLRDTQAGKDAFKKILTQAEIDASLVPEVIDLTVTVHGDTDAVTHLTDKDTAITMPEITVPETHNFKGFATSDGGEVALDVAKNATLKYKDLKDLVAENANTLDLYPVLEAKPIVLDDLVVYVQLNDSLKEAEAKLLVARFNSTLTTEKVKFNFLEQKKAGFISAVKEAGDADVLIGAANTAGTSVDPETAYSAHAQGPGHVAGAKHFADSSRYVMIKDTVATNHLTLAKALYDFVVAEAVEFKVTSAFWHKNNEWVTAAERTAIETGVLGQVKTYLDVADSDSLADIYNVSLLFDTCSSTKVADLITETAELNGGAGVDLIIGCGGDTKTLVYVEKDNMPTTLVAAGRYAALIHDNAISRDVYTNYLTKAAA